jgi:hypothetical protein
MMARDRFMAALAALACFACGEPTEPSTSLPARDALFLRLDDGAIHLVRTDGSQARRISPPGVTGLTPIAITEDGVIAALLSRGGIVLAPVEDLSQQRVVADRVPSFIGPAAFSADGVRLAVPCQLPEGSAVLVYDDEVRRWDTVRVGDPGFFGAPAFSPDGAELLGLGVTTLSFYLIRVQIDSRRVVISRIDDSRILNAPIFGWPRWHPERGLLFLARRGLASGGHDTLAVVSADPDHPDNRLQQIFTTLMAPADSVGDVVFAPYSTYALSPDGELVVLAAQPDSGIQNHALYAGVKGRPHLHPLLDTPKQFPVYPQLIR